MASIGRLRAVLAALCLCALAATNTAQLRVVSTIPDFADLASRIGGDAVQAISLTKGHEDLHLVRIRPSLLIKLRKADVFIQLGLDGEHSWVPAMMRTARNERVQPGQPGFCDASVGIDPLETPDSVTRGSGPDLHPRGNPHYNLDPERMRQAARNIRDCLIRVAPGKKEHFTRRCKAWEAELDKHQARWRKQLAAFKGAEFIEAHSAWVYFAAAFGLKIAGRLEPSPGMAPTPRHLAEVIRIAKGKQVGLVVGRPRYADVARRVAGEAGAEAINLQICSPSKGKHQGWFVYMDHVVATFAKHLRRPGTEKDQRYPGG